jgi:hypothetical protein
MTLRKHSRNGDQPELASAFSLWTVSAAELTIRPRHTAEARYYYFDLRDSTKAELMT